LLLLRSREKVVASVVKLEVNSERICAVKLDIAVGAVVREAGHATSRLPTARARTTARLLLLLFGCTRVRPSQSPVWLIRWHFFRLSQCHKFSLFFTVGGKKHSLNFFDMMMNLLSFFTSWLSNSKTYFHPSLLFISKINFLFSSFKRLQNFV
jgi:hypothetical protein